MIITLIGIALLIVVITGFLILNKLNLPYYIDDNIGFVLAMLAVAGTFITFICLTLILGSYVNVDFNIYNAQLKRDTIIKQIECVDTEYEDTSKIEVINRVYEWNQKVYKQKYYSESPWTNWLFNKKYADALEYIELEDY